MGITPKLDGMGRRIAIFGGTFDPVHVGHIALVVALQEAHKLDSILIIPANQNPHKPKSIPQEAKHRLAMLKRAFRDFPYCQVLKVELDRAGPSYTIDTIRELKAKKVIKPSDTLFLIVGEDQLEGITSWKEANLLPKLLVASRQKNSSAAFTPNFEVSATDIRMRLKKKMYCRHLLDNQVYNYIKRNKLYE